MKHRVYPLFLLFCICIAFLTSCEDKTGVPGEYVGRFNGENGQGINLQLDPNGKGSWTTSENAIPFRWETQSGKILLHTEAGAVIEGKFSQNRIEFTIPATGTVTFEKVSTPAEAKKATSSQ